MYIETRECKKIECDIELEQMIESLETRKDSSFYTKDKNNLLDKTFKEKDYK